MMKIISLFLFPILFFPLAAPTTITTRKHDESKGDPEENLPYTLAFNSPPLPYPQQVQPVAWDSSLPASRSPLFLNPNDKSKGDERILDARGTVRYNFRPDGRIARGVITNKADENAPFLQAEGITYIIIFYCAYVLIIPSEITSHADTYDVPVLDEEFEEEEED
jgi:hypothetical protein